MSKPLLLVGCGGHARALIDVVESGKKWQIWGLVGTPEEVGWRVFNYPVLGSNWDLPKLREKCPNALLAIGQIGASVHRHRLAKQLKDLDFTIPILISNHAVISRHAKIGSGTTVGHGAIVNGGAQVGNHCILNSRALVEHDVLIGDFCHISTGALVNGGVKIGDGSFIGSGAMLREGLELPPNTVISAGKRIMGWPIQEGKVQ